MKILSLTQGERQLLNRVSRRRLAAGFTIIELMIVISIIMILVGIAAVQYQKSVQRAKEATLRQDLMAMRQSIDNYTLDKQAAPQSLDDLAQAGYLRLVPKDPMTGAADWDVQFDSVVLSPDQSGTGLTDVHSHSSATSPFEGTPYNQW